MRFIIKGIGHTGGTNKVAAIREFRLLTRADLKYAKDAVEAADGHTEYVAHEDTPTNYMFKDLDAQWVQVIPAELEALLRRALTEANDARLYDIAAGVALLLARGFRVPGNSNGD